MPAGVFLFAGAIEGCFSSWNGGRRCWDLNFLDAQTGSMNSTKMAMKVGNSPVITRKFNPLHCGERGLFIPLALGQIFLNYPLPTHLQLTYKRFQDKITR